MLNNMHSSWASFNKPTLQDGQGSIRYDKRTIRQQTCKHIMFYELLVIMLWTFEITI